MLLVQCLFGGSIRLDYEKTILPESPRAIEVVGNYLYGVLDWGLLVFDVADKSQPRLVSNLALDDQISRCLLATDSFVYLSGKFGGLYTIDVRDAESPKLVGQRSDVGQICSFARRDTLVFAQTEYERLLLLSIADPIHPCVLKVDHCDSRNLLWSGDYLYAENYKLQITSVKDPINLSFGDICDTTGFLGGMVLFDTLAIGPCYDGLHYVGVANPQRPYWTGRAGPEMSSEGIARIANFVYVWGWDGLTVLSLAEPTRPYVTYHDSTSSLISAFASKGIYAYASDLHRGLIVYDASNPSHPLEVGRWQPSSSLSEYLASTGDKPDLCTGVEKPALPLALAVDRESGECRTVNIQKLLPSDWRKTYRYHGNGTYVNMVEGHICDCYGGDFVTAAIGENGNLTHVKKIAARFYCGDCLVKRPYTYIADYDSGLMIVDISDFESPHRVAALKLPGPVSNLDTLGDYLLLGCSASGLQVVDISDPHKPDLIAAVDTPWFFVESVRMGCCDGPTDNPANDIALRKSDTARWKDQEIYHLGIVDIAAYGENVILSSSPYGLIVVNLFDPKHPRVVQTTDAYLCDVSLTIADGKLYAHAFGGVHVFKVVESGAEP